MYGSIEAGKTSVCFLRRWHVRLRHDGDAESALFHVAHYADNRHPWRLRCVDSPPHMVTDWIAAWPQQARGGLVDDYDERTALNLKRLLEEPLLSLEEWRGDVLLAGELRLAKLWLKSYVRRG